MIQLIVNGNALETSEGEDLSLVLNKSINDFDDISARSSSYSFDFELPPTANNTRALFAVSDVNALGDIGRENAILLIDGVEYDRGTVFAFESQLGGNYTVTYQSGLVTWAEEISNVKLNQLPWRGVEDSGTENATELFTATRLGQLRNGDVTDFDLNYPIINRNNGGFSGDARPQIYLKAFITNLFSKIGWTVDGGFLNKEEIKGGVTIQDQFNNDYDFKGVMLDPPFNFEVDEEVIEASRIEYVTEVGGAFGFNTNTLVGNNGDFDNPVIVLEKNPIDFFTNQIDGAPSLYDPTTNKYTVPTSNNYTYTIDPKIEHNFFDFDFNDWARDNSFNVAIISARFFRNGQIVGEIDLNNEANRFGRSFSIDILATEGDEIYFELIFRNVDVFGQFFSPTEIKERRAYLTFDSTINIQRKSRVELGENYRINSHLPDIPCLELLQDIKLMYNLMFITNEKRKKVTIETWEDFYKDIGNAENITDNLDLTEPPTINHLSDYTKDLEFRYKADDNDGYLKRWQQINERTYARYRQSLIPSNKFENGTTNFETKIISPSIQGKLNDSDIIVGMARGSFDLDDEDTGLRTGYNTRIGYCVNGKQYYSDGTERSPFTITTALMESFGNVPILNDFQLTFNGENGLIARNWTKTLGVIQLGKRVQCKMLLSKYEFFNFDFSRPVFIEYPTKLKGYYLVEKLENFEVTDANLFSTEVSLIKYKDVISVEIDGSQSTNVNENTSDNQQDANQETFVFTVSNEGEQDETINQVYVVRPDGSFNNVVI